LTAFRVNEERVRVVSGLLALSKRLVDRAEDVDPQLSAVSAIVRSFERAADALFYVVGVASVSYQLATTGEEHWALAAEYARGDPVASLRRFVLEAPSLRVQRAKRLARVERLARYYPTFASRLNGYLSDLRSLWADLAEALSADPRSKTVVFSVKMFYYAARALGVQLQVPHDIPLPVDRRVCLISLASRVIEGAAPTPEGARKLLSVAPELVAEAWGRVGALAGVPPLRLDALLWLMGGCYARSRSAERALSCALELLSPPPGPPLALVRVLLGLSP